MKRQLVVMARWPAPGRCKQRLASGLGNRRAAQIQQQLLGHTLATAKHWAAQNTNEPALVLAVSGLGPRAASRWSASLGCARWQPQGPGQLGLRMQRQFARAWREGAEQVVLIGSDLPTLEAADLEQAFALLADQAEGGPDLVLGPSRDGGYWLIGLALDRAKRGAIPWQPGWLLAGIPWGSPQVLGCTLERASQRQLRVALLNEHGDVDWPHDLRRWR